MILINPSFEDGWRDKPPAPGNLVNQEPAGWMLSWVEPGLPLYDAPNDRAGGVPECVHKHVDQLPPAERPDGTDPLILDGEYVYKIFHGGAAFAAELAQRIAGLAPGEPGFLTVRARLHRHGDGDDYGAEIGVWVNGSGRWHNAGELGDRKWTVIDVPFNVAVDGTATPIIRVKSKWTQPKDFFLDDLLFFAPTVVEPEPEPVTVAIPPGATSITFNFGE